MISIGNMFFYIAIVLSIIVFVDLIYMIVKYQRDKMLPIYKIGEEEILNKYGSIVCSCILQKRSFLQRDIIAIIVELIQKDVIFMSLKKTSEEGKYIYQYTLKKNEKSEIELSDLEINTIDIVFGDSDEVIFNNVISDIKQNGKILKLKKIVDAKLSDIGANAVKVPKKIQVANNVFFIMVCVFFIINLVAVFDGTDFLKNLESTFKFWTVIVIKLDALVILGYILVKMILLLIERMTTKFNNYEITITDDLVINIFIKFVLVNGILLILLLFAGTNLAFIADIVLFDISFVAMITDELYFTHSKKLQKEYISLKDFEARLITNDFIDNFNLDRFELMKKSIPFMVASDIKGVDLNRYISKAVNASLEKNEKEKYEKLLCFLSFNEEKINNFYYIK